MSSAATTLCHSAQVGTGGATGHVRVRVRLTLIALCNKWRGQCREIIMTHTVSVNRRGTRTTAPQMNTFKQWGVTLLSSCGITHWTHFYAQCTQWKQSKKQQTVNVIWTHNGPAFLFKFKSQLSQFQDLHCSNDFNLHFWFFCALSLLCIVWFFFSEALCNCVLKSVVQIKAIITIIIKVTPRFLKSPQYC